jgi:hypothetical protein
MESAQPHFPAGQIIAISRSDRWQICHRLQELNIPCHCLHDGSLYAELNSPLAAIQLWSVVFHSTSSRQQLVNWLEKVLA